MKAKEPLFDTSALVVFLGVILLFLSAILITLIAPRYIDPTWTQPTSYYQVQMYEVADPHIYISSAAKGTPELQFVRHLKEGFTLQAFEEGSQLRLVAPEELQRYITRFGDSRLKLTTRLLLLRPPEGEMRARAEEERRRLQEASEGPLKIDYEMLELYDPGLSEAFSVMAGDQIEDFVSEDFEILEERRFAYQSNPGVIYIKNPREYRIGLAGIGRLRGWQYDPSGKRVESLQELTGEELGFRSRKELIALGEELFAQEGCWYCHTDQTRTLIQDTVLNGSASYPAPPSSPNEYIYQKTTFPGTRRIGPDLSRVGIKRPGRDWHQSHFWSPRTESPGSVMPPFQHFFDDDPRGTEKAPYGVPNYKFEAVFQYLMTKGTRITPPNQAWWEGKDPIDTLKIIEGEKVLPR